MLSDLQAFRESFNGLAEFVDQNRKLLSRISAIFLSLVPWIQVSRSRALLLLVNPAVFLLAVGMGALLHIILLAFNSLAVKGLSAVSGGSRSIFTKEENANAFILVASQKTLPVLVAVVEQLGGVFGESGLLVLPCVAAHLNQIIMDSFLVNNRLLKHPTPKDAKAA
uniref:Putative sodium/metabolite cotransporter BASS4ic n=1 Tax=Rhizophora mucronata TaxID=61149 RepID=A0A2P2K7T6_RHIMU